MATKGIIQASYVATVRDLPEPFTSRQVADALGLKGADYVIKSMAGSGWIVSTRIGPNRVRWYRRTANYGITAEQGQASAAASMEALHQAMAGWRIERIAA